MIYPVCSESEKRQHIHQASFKPVGSLLFCLAPLFYWTVHAIEHEYYRCVQSEQPAEAVEQHPHLRVLACMVMAVTKWNAALHKPDAVRAKYTAKYANS